MPSFTTDDNAIRPYLTDESSSFTGHADRLYFPTSAAEVAQILQEATATGVSVTVSGGGTSITGARVPTGGGRVLATDRLVHPEPPDSDAAWQRAAAGDGEIYVDAEAMRAVVPPGIRLSDLDGALAPFGLFYPPTLTETSAMVGGTIATNASGARSYHYGPTRAWVDALQLVTADGRLLRVGRGERSATDGVLELDAKTTVTLPDLPHAHRLTTMKNAAGYFLHPTMDAVDLFVGGEGTLTVITEAHVRLARREDQAVILVAFGSDRDRLLDAADAVRCGLFNPWRTLALEYFDANSLVFMRGSYGDIPDASGAILLELAPPTPDQPGDADQRWTNAAGVAGQWSQRLRDYAVVDTWVMLPTEREQARLFRHSLPDRVNDYVRTRRGKLGTDLAVPPEHFRELVCAYDEAAGQGIRTVLFGHLGEYHLHLNFLADDADQLERALAAYARLARTAVELDGTVSAEHGVGKKQIRLEDGSSVAYLQLMFGLDGLRALAHLKRQLDPAWILNPETVLPQAAAGWSESV